MSSFDINEDAQSAGEFSGSSGNEGSQPIESAFPDEDEDTITMVDLIEREDKLEEEASAVLGNSDEMNCTYPKGYISRQALYSCATCSEGSDQQAAICLACSLECHDNHELYELYTKRNYRCDCGNSKFKKDFECKLMDKTQKKSSSNDNNKYNHNFSGRYCVCNKKYPPDEGDDSIEANDEMWQCIVCEDWYHTKHLGTKELPTKFEELICGPCCGRLEFVYYYKDVDKMDAINPFADSTGEKDVEDSRPATNIESKSTSEVSKSELLDQTINQPSSSTSSQSTAQVDGVAVGECDTNDSQAENKDPRHGTDSTSIDKSDCILDRLKSTFEANRNLASQSKDYKGFALEGPLFWFDCSWRSKLCRCQKCLAMYTLKECEYLLDEKDTVQYYEAQGKAISRDSGSSFERGMSALNRMNRTAVVEALHGYDELKANLSSYLRKFADSKKVVREEDIHEFFHQLRSKKRPKLDYSEL